MIVFFRIALQLLVVLLLLKIFFPDIGDNVHHIVTVLISMADQFITYVAQVAAR